MFGPTRKRNCLRSLQRLTLLGFTRVATLREAMLKILQEEEWAVTPARWNPAPLLPRCPHLQ